MSQKKDKANYLKNGKENNAIFGNCIAWSSQTNSPIKPQFHVRSGQAEWGKAALSYNPKPVVAWTHCGQDDRRKATPLQHPQQSIAWTQRFNKNKKIINKGKCQTLPASTKIRVFSPAMGPFGALSAQSHFQRPTVVKNPLQCQSTRHQACMHPQKQFLSPAAFTPVMPPSYPVGLQQNLNFGPQHIHRPNPTGKPFKRYSLNYDVVQKIKEKAHRVSPPMSRSSGKKQGQLQPTTTQIAPRQTVKSQCTDQPFYAGKPFKASSLSMDVRQKIEEKARQVSQLKSRSSGKMQATLHPTKTQPLQRSSLNLDVVKKIEAKALHVARLKSRSTGNLRAQLQPAKVQTVLQQVVTAAPSQIVDTAIWPENNPQPACSVTPLQEQSCQGSCALTHPIETPSNRRGWWGDSIEWCKATDEEEQVIWTPKDSAVLVKKNTKVKWRGSGIDLVALSIEEEEAEQALRFQPSPIQSPTSRMQEVFCSGFLTPLRKGEHREALRSSCAARVWALTPVTIHEQILPEEIGSCFEPEEIEESDAQQVDLRQCNTSSFVCSNPDQEDSSISNSGAEGKETPMILRLEESFSRLDLDLNKTTAPILIVFDTNTYINEIDVLVDLIENLAHIRPDVSILLPREVHRELDYLKKDNTKDSKFQLQARTCCRLLDQMRIQADTTWNEGRIYPILRGQRDNELYRDKGFHRHPQHLRHDDAILNCCLFFSRSVYPRRQVFLFTDDKMFRSKAKYNGIGIGDIYNSDLTRIGYQ